MPRLKGASAAANGPPFPKLNSRDPASFLPNLRSSLSVQRAACQVRFVLKFGLLHPLRPPTLCLWWRRGVCERFVASLAMPADVSCARAPSLISVRDPVGSGSAT